MIPARMPSILKNSPALADCEAAGNAPVRSIAMVGALMQMDGHLWPTDQIYLHRIFEVCAAKNILIHRDVELGIMNLEYNGDFLTRQPQADMIVLSNIFYAPGFQSSYPLTRQSPHAGNIGRWQESIIATGARYAFNIYFRDRSCAPLPNEAIEATSFAPPEIFADDDNALARDMAFTYR